MTDQNSYKTMGLNESSSFEQIQEARERLLKECEGDRKRTEAIEAAYDAILMERLRLRQEGKIKVPDRIRFAEETPEVNSNPSKDSSGLQWSWLSNFLDTPSRQETLLPALIFASLALVSLAVPSFALAIGVACTIYFLNRKESRFWRAILITIASLIVGLTIGILIGQVLASQINLATGNSGEVVQIVASTVALVVFWVTSSFIR
ncbi:MAG: CPP1-like family protein [Cyanobacteria bacterium P01_H01_bin.58]